MKRGQIHWNTIHRKSTTLSGQPAESQVSDVEPTVDLGGQESRLAEILDHYLAQMQNGEAPSRDELKRRHPDLAEQLDACLAGLEFIHGSASGSASRSPG